MWQQTAPAKCEPGQLARDRGGRRLVELAHPFGDLSRRDARRAR